MAKAPSRHAHGRSELWDRPEIVARVLKERRRLERRLGALRRERDLTQTETAELAGLHPIHVARIETGVANATIATLVALTCAYSIPMKTASFGRT